MCFFIRGGRSSAYIQGCYNLAVDVKCICCIYLCENQWCTLLLCWYKFCCQERELSRNNSIYKNCIYIVDYLRYHAINMFFCGVCFLCHSVLYSRITSTKSLPFCATFFVMSLTNLMVLVPRWRDCVCYVSSRVLDPALLQLQKHTDIRANNVAHSPSLWHQHRLADVTCARSWRLCEINPAIIFWMQGVNIWCL